MHHQWYRCHYSLNEFAYHDDFIKWKHFPRYWPFVWGIHRSPVNSLHKSQWRGALVFSLIYARINGWVNNREAGDLWRHRAHCDVIVMTPRASSVMASSNCVEPKYSWPMWYMEMRRKHLIEHAIKVEHTDTTMSNIELTVTYDDHARTPCRWRKFRPGWLLKRTTISVFHTCELLTGMNYTNALLSIVYQYHSDNLVWMEQWKHLNDFTDDRLVSQEEIPAFFRSMNNFSLKWLGET